MLSSTFDEQIQEELIVYNINNNFQ